MDALYDPACHGPRATIGLTLYFRQQKQLQLSSHVYGKHWTAFWWWTAGAAWPTHENDVLQHDYGTCSMYDYYCFQRLPTWATENRTELLAIDSRGTVYRWKFDSTNPTAHAVWNALHDHIMTRDGEVIKCGWRLYYRVPGGELLNQDNLGGECEACWWEKMQCFTYIM